MLELECDELEEELEDLDEDPFGELEYPEEFEELVLEMDWMISFELILAELIIEDEEFVFFVVAGVLV